MVDGVEDDHAHGHWSEAELEEAKFAVRTIVKNICGNRQLKATDRSLVIKVAVLSVRRFSADWLQDALAGTKACGPNNRFSYFHTCLENGAAKLRGRFDQELAKLEGNIPESLLACLDEVETPVARLCVAGEI